MIENVSTGPVIIYDGSCPFCKNYIRYYRAKQAFGEIELVNARERWDLAERLAAMGYDLDVGFVFIDKGRIYHGDAAMIVLAQAGRKRGLFNRLNHLMFRSPKRARLLYPVLRLGRKLALRLLRRRLIADDLERKRHD